MTKTPSRPFSIPNETEAISDVGTVRALKLKFDQAKDPTDRFGYGIQHAIMAFVEREIKRMGEDKTAFTNMMIVEALAQGCAYSSFSIIMEMATRSGHPKAFEGAIESLGLYMQMQHTMINRLIIETTRPEGETVQ
jgi:hypothetical protein